MLLSILLQGIWDTVLNIFVTFVTFRDIEYIVFRKINNLPVYKEYVPVNCKGYGIFGSPYTSLLSKRV